MKASFDLVPPSAPNAVPTADLHFSPLFNPQLRPRILCKGNECGNGSDRQTWTLSHS